AIHAPHNFREQTKIDVRCGAQRGAIDRRVKVGDVTADGHMRREWNLRLVSSTKQRKTLVFRFQPEQRATKRLAQPESLARALARCAIQESSRFFRAAKRARAQRRINVFGS